MGFNPRSPRSRGATTSSTRSSVQPSEFQPTLPAFTRSDSVCDKALGGCGFQPTLPAFTRSDFGSQISGSSSEVSTHAPRVHEERPKVLRIEEFARVSTHAPRVHEERRRRGTPIPGSRRFNPRSPRSRGATQPPGEEALRPRFNPRSPRSRGATSSDPPAAPEASFQPTLPAFTRSDNPEGNGVAAGHVSTHAPRVHEERLTTRFVRVVEHEVSTHAPRVHEERRSNGASVCRTWVSTHAPRVHEERPCPSNILF